MCRKSVLVIVAMAMFALAAPANAELINVNLDVLEDPGGEPPNPGPREESLLDGPYDGDGGSDLGTTWNQLLAGAGFVDPNRCCVQLAGLHWRCDRRGLQG